jgi:hypothetical protein
MVTTPVGAITGLAAAYPMLFVIASVPELLTCTVSVVVPASASEFPAYAEALKAKSGRFFVTVKANAELVLAA